jgi:hypothetical protein
VTAHVRRREPFERRHRPWLRAREPLADRVDPVGCVVEQLVGGALVLGRLREPAHVAQDLSERHRVEGDHLRLRRELLRDGANVVDRDRTDLTQRLSDDQIRLERAQLLGIELIEVLATCRALPNGRVDLLAREPLGDHRAREMWQLRGLCRIIALVCDPDDVGAQSESEEHLRRGGNEACYAHE